jgi:hypothetical protein
LKLSWISKRESNKLQWRRSVLFLNLSRDEFDTVHTAHTECSPRCYIADKIFWEKKIFVTLCMCLCVCVCLLFFRFTRENLRRLPVFGLGLKVRPVGFKDKKKGPTTTTT